MPTYHIQTLGCQMNFSDTQVYAALIEEAGFLPERYEVADVVIINTCAVREASVHKMESWIGVHAKRKRETGLPKIGVIGCVPAIDLSEFKRVHPQVDFILPTFTDKKAMEVALQETLELNPVEGLTPRRSQITTLIPITSGCNSFCTYCIVPYTRGRLVSRPMDEIFVEAKSAIEAGAKEIFLLGQNVNVYGKDLDQSDGFVRLLERIDDIPGLLRIRFMTNHPRDMDEETLIRMREIKNLSSHFHLPVQSGSNQVLKLMNRGYTLLQYKHLISKIRDIFPTCSVTTDIIVGFPGETPSHFKETLNLLEEVRFEQVYAAMYSKRPKTPAANFVDQVADAELHNRINELLDVQRKISNEIAASYIGKQTKVLIDHTEGGLSVGYNQTGRLIRIQGQIEPGIMVGVCITKSSLGSLNAELLKEVGFER